MAGIEKPISGAQTGADRAYLDLAIERGLPQGGWRTSVQSRNLPQHLNKFRRLVTFSAGDVQSNLPVVAAWQVSQPLHALEPNVDFGSEPAPLESNDIYFGSGYADFLHAALE
jgi:hypothetical protein